MTMSNPPYKIERHSTDGGVVRLMLCGEFDIAATEDLRRQLTEVLEVDRAAEVCVDLGEVSLIDSTIIHVLMNGCRNARQIGTPWCVANAHGLVRRVLQTTGVLDTLSEPDTSADA